MQSGYLYRTFSVLAAALLLASCSDRDITGSNPVRRADITTQSDQVVGTDGQTYTLVSRHGIADAVTASAWMDAKGGGLQLKVFITNGEVKIEQHEITVSKGTVSEPTLFVMRAGASSHIQLDLEAYQYDEAGNLVSVGEVGFVKPIKLVMSWKYAEGVDKPAELTALWDRLDGSYEKTASKSDISNKTLVVTLWHFSRYAMAQRGQ